MDNNNIKKSTSTPVSLTEHLSALLDNETGSFEQRRVLDELKSNGDLRQKLSSYALIGEVMRTTEVTATADSGFLAGIQTQIESEDEYRRIELVKTTNDSANDTHNSSWLRPVGGFALAASIATVAFFGFQNFQQSNGNMIDTSLTTVANTTPTTLDSSDLSEEKMAVATVVSATQIASASANEYQQADARTRMLLKRYVDSHLEYASNTAFVPSVRVIAYAN